MNFGQFNQFLNKHVIRQRMEKIKSTKIILILQFLYLYLKLDSCNDNENTFLVRITFLKFLFFATLNNKKNR